MRFVRIKATQGFGEITLTIVTFWNLLWTLFRKLQWIKRELTVCPAASASAGYI
jgi:hypothetical protein